MLDRLAQIEKRFNDIEQEMAAPEAAEDSRRLQNWPRNGRVWKRW
jgi:hypothetical protein